MPLMKLVAFEPLHQRLHRLYALFVHCHHDQFLFASHFLLRAQKPLYPTFKGLG